MVSQLFALHDDFKSSRRALFISSIITIIFVRMNLQSDAIELFQLKIGVNKNELVLFSTLTTLYFLFVFVINSVIEQKMYILKHSELMEGLIENLRQKIEVRFNTSFDDFSKETKDSFINSLSLSGMFHTSQAKWIKRKFKFVMVAPAILLAIIALGMALPLIK